MTDMSDSTEVGTPATSVRPAGMTTVLYRHYDSGGRAIYYGISDTPEQRETAHRSQSLWAKLSARRTEEWFASRQEADAAEREAIKTDEPLFNREHNTLGAERRLVQYLVDQGLHDLLAPNWPRQIHRQQIANDSPPQGGYFDLEQLRQIPYATTEQILTHPQHLRTFHKSAPVLFLPPDLLVERYTAMAQMCRDAGQGEVSQKVQNILQLQSLMNDSTRRFEVLIGDHLLLASEGAEEVLHRIAAASYRSNIRVGCLVLGRRLPIHPPDVDLRIHDHIFVHESMLGEKIEPTGGAARLKGRHLDLIWPAAVTGDELRKLIALKLSGKWDGTERGLESQIAGQSVS